MKKQNKSLILKALRSQYGGGSAGAFGALIQSSQIGLDERAKISDKARACSRREISAL